MSFSRTLLAFSFVAVISGTASWMAWGQDPPAKQADPPAAKGKPGPRDIEARFFDGSTMRATVLDEHVDIETRYGKLTVPIVEIRRIEFGLRLSPEEAKTLESAMRQIASEDFKDRETGSDRLFGLGEKAVPAMKRAAKSEDAEVARRARSVLEALDTVLTDDQMAGRDQDQIQTADFPVVGRVVNSQLKVRTAYFGEQPLKLSELRSIHSRAGSGGGEVTIDAAQYAVANAWKETEVEIAAGSKLLVTAAGQVDLWPETPGQYMSGPDGYQQQAGPRRVPIGARQVGGELIGRIGQQGKPFLIGSKYEGKPTEAGKLYLTIGPSPWNNASTGSYSVKLATQGE